MKKIITLLLILSTNFTFASRESVQAVKEVVELYQDEVMKQTGNYVSVIFDSQERFQANAKIYKEGSIIRIYAQMVKELAPLELVTIACHELGHILGEIRHANILGGEIRHFREAIEGEADYFAGGCLRRYVGSEEAALSVAAKAYQKLHHMSHPIDSSLAEEKSIKGILVGYPTPECRLLTVFNGIEDKERPKCWYNPQ